MSPARKTYRVYCFDNSSHVVSVDEIEAADDAEAIAAAESLGFATKCELWDGRRLVAAIDGERKVG